MTVRLGSTSMNCPAPAPAPTGQFIAVQPSRMTLLMPDMMQ